LTDDHTPVIEARGLHRFFFSGSEEEIAALRDVSFELGHDEFVAVVGPSGSGKSTLLHLLAGLDEPSGGSAWIAGRRMSYRSRREQALFRGCAIGVLTQASRLVDHLSVLQNVQLGAWLRDRARRSRRARQLGLDATARREEQHATSLLEDVDIAGRRAARPSTLSGGETARANLAVALAGQPQILLADEPTAEISRVEEADLLERLSALRPAGGALLVVTHSDAVAAAADRVIELVDGTVR
jgi:putative ABC transport system ATP-binding protein